MLNPMARRAPVAVAALLCACVVGCGTGGNETAKPARPVADSATVSTHSGPPTTVSSVGATKPDDDNDGDNGADDSRWGRAAIPAEKATVTTLIKHYYAIAVAGDGTRACPLIYSIFAEEIPETYGEQPGEPALSGKTCAEVMSKVFKQSHRRLTSELAALRVTVVRVKGLRGLALLDFGRPPVREIGLHLEHGAWRIDDLLDGALG